MPLDNACRDRMIELVRDTVIGTIDYFMIEPLDRSVPQAIADAFNATRDGINDWDKALKLCGG